MNKATEQVEQGWDGSSVGEYLRRTVRKIREDKENVRFMRMLLLLNKARGSVPENKNPCMVDMFRTPRVHDKHPRLRKLRPASEHNSSDGLQQEVPTEEVFLDSQPAMHVNFPRCTSRIRIPYTIFSLDKPELGFIPGIVEELSGSDQSGEVSYLLGIYKSKSRSRRIARGPQHVQKENNHEVKMVLENLHSLKDNSLDEAALKSLVVNDVFGYLGEKQNWLEEKLKMYFKNSYCTSNNQFIKHNTARPMNGGTDNIEDSHTHNHNDSDGSVSDDESVITKSIEDYLDYESVVASPATLYCARCKQYECNLHFQPYGNKKTPSVRLRFRAGMEAEGCRKGPLLQDSKQLSKPHIQPQLTSLQMSICQHLFLIYEGNAEKVATFLDVERKLVKDFCCEIIPTLKVKNKSDLRSTMWYSVKNYQKRVLMSNAALDTFEPCIHQAHTCKAGLCSCIDQNIFCLKTCVLGVGSCNFFRGCDCSGSCGPQCTCRVYMRECDPDLCNCGTCLDTPGEPISKQNCDNDNITMNRKIQTCIAISDISNAGFGLFSRFPIGNGQFINEYVGELITHDEAERRGQLYDLIKDTSHFDLPRDMCLDASNMCNEMRFINNSIDEPNVKQMRWLIEGTSRIAMYAQQDIPAQTELTFNYGFSIDLGHISSAGKKSKLIL